MRRLEVLKDAERLPCSGRVRYGHGGDCDSERGAFSGSIEEGNREGESRWGRGFFEGGLLREGVEIRREGQESCGSPEGAIYREQY
jgi:hypothetical protein